MPLTEKRQFNRAYSQIVSAIEGGEFGDHTPFPSIASLAAKTGVSAGTVWKVINRLKEEGRLGGKPGGRAGLHDPRSGLPEGSTDRGGLPLRQTKWRAVLQRIRGDILNGRLRHDRPLPREKELAVAHGVARLTLRKALAALAGEGVISRRGARYFPLSIIPPASLSPQRVVLLGPGTNLGHNITYGYWHQESYKLLEQECARARMTLGVVCFYHERGGPLRFNDELPRIEYRGNITSKPDVAGYIYLVTGADSIEEKFLRELAATGRPVAVFDEIGTWPTPAFLKEHPNVRVFRNTISALAARKVARCLLELGHRTAVYISPYHHLEYSRLRYDGLAREFAAVEGARIVAVTSQAAASEAVPQKILRSIDKMQDRGYDWTKSFPSAYRDTMVRCFDMLTGAIGEGRVRESVMRLCDQALGIRGATAWVTVNDECAVCAFDFLEKKAVSVPEKISMISFDDLPMALTNGISSYNFNYPAVMIAMLGYITNPRLYPVSRQVIEIEGQVIPRRRTLGPRKT